MIVEMRRVLVFGPKRLLAPVMEEIQRIGALHIDRVEAEEASLATLQPDETASASLATLERLRVRVEGALSLLPETPGDARTAAPHPSADGLAEAEIDALEAEIASIEGEIRALTRRRLDAEEELELIRTYEGAVRVLSPLLGALRDSKAVETVGFILRGKDLTVVTAVRNQLTELTNGRVEVVSRTVEEGKIGVVVAFLRRDEEIVRNFLTQAGISELRLPARYAEAGPAEAVRAMERRREEVPQELAEVDRLLREASRRYRPRLLAIRALLTDRLAQLRALPNLAESRYTFILHGWAPANRVPEIRTRLRDRFRHEVVVYDAPIDPHHTADVPVLLDNPAPLRPFQRLLALFRPPRYGTLDPTLYLAIFFPVFVGLVVGDVAIGVLLFLFGWWMRNKARRGEAWDVALGPIKLGIRIGPEPLADMSWIVRVLAAWTILFGVLYLEVFGNLLEHYFGLHPIFNRVESAQAFFYITVAAGLVQVMLGYLLHLVLAARHGHLVGVLESLTMISGVAALFAVLGAMGNVLPQSFFTPGVILIVAFLVFLAIGFILNRMAAMWLLEAISGMGNVLSYARLFGVGLAAAVIANVANDLGQQLSGGYVIIGIIAGIIIQMIILLFTFAGHIIQPARLNWVEFLTKFKYHDETGNSYQPLHKTGGG